MYYYEGCILLELHPKEGCLFFVINSKKRALKLQQRKEKQALQRHQQREAQLQREQELVGKPNVSKGVSPNSPSNANPPS